MNQRTRALLAASFIGVIFLLVQLGSLALVEPFKAAGFQAVEDPQDPTNSLIYIAAILVMTAVMLAVFRLNVEGLIRAFIVFASAYIGWYVFSVVVPPLATLGGFNILAIGAALLLGAALYAYPEWYVIDSAGVVMGAGAAGLFGISFGLLPAILLLSVLALYDAISVYGTEHMLTLASGVMDLKVPIVLVVPLTLSYSFIDADMPDPTDEEDDAETAATSDEDPDAAGESGVTELAADGQDPSEADTVDTDEEAEEIEADPMDREALFIGLGDAVIPTVLVASAAFFAPASTPTVNLPGISLTLPVGSAMLGTFVGLAILLWMVLKGRAHAGLPLLNGGTIAGYLVGALASGIPIAEAIGLARYL